MIGECNKSASILIGLAILSSNIFASGGNSIFKAYTNFSLGTTIAIMSIKNLPIALILGIIIPFKIIIPPYKSKLISMLLYPLLAVAISYAPIIDLANIESCSGHNALFYVLVIIGPPIWHLIYTFT